MRKGGRIPRAVPATTGKGGLRPRHFDVPVWKNVGGRWYRVDPGGVPRFSLGSVRSTTDN